MEICAYTIVAIIALLNIIVIYKEFKHNREITKLKGEINMNKRAEYKEVTKEQQDKIDLIRSSFSNMYDVLDINCKSSREISLAYTKLEEAQFWAIKGITREED